MKSLTLKGAETYKLQVKGKYLYNPIPVISVRYILKITIQQ